MDTFLNLLDNLEDDTVTGECKVEEPQTLHQQATILEGLCQEAPSDTPSFLKQNTVHLAPLPYHDAIQQQQVKNRVRDIVSFANVLNINQDTVLQMY